MIDYQATDVLTVDKAVVDTVMVVDNTFPKVVDQASLKVVDRQAVVDNSFQVVDNLSHLIHLYQTHTNYHCASTCCQNKYCSNC